MYKGHGLSFVSFVLQMHAESVLADDADLVTVDDEEDTDSPSSSVESAANFVTSIALCLAAGNPSTPSHLHCPQTRVC